MIIGQGNWKESLPSEIALSGSTQTHSGPAGNLWTLDFAFPPFHFNVGRRQTKPKQPWVPKPNRQRRLLSTPCLALTFRPVLILGPRRSVEFLQQLQTPPYLPSVSHLPRRPLPLPLAYHVYASRMYSWPVASFYHCITSQSSQSGSPISPSADHNTFTDHIASHLRCWFFLLLCIYFTDLLPDPAE